jgi:hypothetical protein
MIVSKLIIFFFVAKIRKIDGFSLSLYFPIPSNSRGLKKQIYLSFGQSKKSTK